MLKKRMAIWEKVKRNVKLFNILCIYFCFFRLNRDLIFLYSYGVLLVCNRYHIGVHTMDISRRKVVISNTKRESLGRLASYH